MRKTRRWPAILVGTAALVLTPIRHAVGHETGAIHLTANHIPVGGEIELRGEKLPKSETLKLELRGILDTYPVGEVKTDTGGAFQAKFTLPASAPAAAYTLVAIASDGDVTARADLTVVAGTTVAATTPAAGSSSMPGMPGMSGMSSEASAAPMQIASTTTTAQWVVIYAVIALSLASGLLLLRRSATNTLTTRE